MQNRSRISRNVPGAGRVGTVQQYLSHGLSTRSAVCTAVQYKVQKTWQQYCCLYLVQQYTADKSYIRYTYSSNSRYSSSSTFLQQCQQAVSESRRIMYYMTSPARCICHIYTYHTAIVIHAYHTACINLR